MEYIGAIILLAGTLLSGIGLIRYADYKERKQKNYRVKWGNDNDD